MREVIDGVCGEDPIFPFTRDYPEPTPFYEVGHIIDFNGATGVIEEITDGPHTLMRDYPIRVRMDDGKQLYFTGEGKFLKEMDRASITIIGTMPVTVKKYIWVYLYKGSWCATMDHYTEALAKDIFSSCKKLIRIDESEIEVTI